MAKQKRKNGALFFGLILAVFATVGLGAGQGWFESEETEALEGVPVRRGPLRISELSKGNLKAKNAARLVNLYEDDARIIYLAEEGSWVEEGDLICELDVSDLEDRRVTQEIEVKAAEAALTKSTEQYEIQEIQNEADADDANLALELAQLDLEKYIKLGDLPSDYDPAADDAVNPEEGEWAHELAKAEESIHIAKLELAQSEETLEWTRKLYDKGFVQRTEFERDELSVQRAGIQVEQAQREYDLARQYGYRRKLAELQAEVQRRERDILTVKKQAVARLADMEADREADRYRLQRERERFTEILENLGYGKIHAPIGGMLVYSRSKSRWGGGEVVKEGGTLYERQEVASIPREGGMVVEVSLHETKLDNVRVGQRVLVRVDAIPRQVFEGEVQYVAAVADSGSWMSNPNERLYRTEVSLTESVPEMRPGMSCEVEVLVADLEDVLYVPNQSVYVDGHDTVCFKVTENGPEVVPVKVGPDNMTWIVIEDGLSESDEILLSPPSSWTPTEVEDKDPFPGGRAEPVAPGKSGASSPGQRGSSSGAPRGGSDYGGSPGGGGKKGSRPSGGGGGKRGAGQ